MNYQGELNYDFDDGWEQEWKSPMAANSRRSDAIAQQKTSDPAVSSPTTPSENPSRVVLNQRYEEGICNGSYCCPPSQTGSVVRNHGYFPTSTKGNKDVQRRTVVASLFAKYIEETDTLEVSVVACYAYDQKNHDTFGWENYDKRVAAVTHIHKLLSKLDNNGSSCTRLRSKFATNIKGRVEDGQTIGNGFMRFMNTMIYENDAYEFKFEEDGEDCRVSFREGTWDRPDATDEITAYEGPWLAPLLGDKAWKLGEREEIVTRNLISKGTTCTSGCQNCVIGDMPIWTAEQTAE